MFLNIKKKFHEGVIKPHCVGTTHTHAVGVGERCASLTNPIAVAVTTFDEEKQKRIASRW
jgi:hypothetical protein